MRHFCLLLLLPLTGCAQRPAGPPAPHIAGETINVHEHIQGVDEAEPLLEAMNRTGVKTTLLMGSSWFTVTMNQRDGFTRVPWNNEQLLKIVEKYPGRFEAWPTLNPLDPDKLEKLQELVRRGATGLKLYTGHGLLDQRRYGYFFHPVAMDHWDMLPVFAWLEAEGIPIMFHVNPGPKTPGFAEEFATVLDLFPDMKVIAPHFILSSIRSSRLEQFLQAYPNLYTDLSFGHDDFLLPGLKRIHKSPKKFRRLLRKYPDRFMFGTDVVVTRVAFKTPEWIAMRFQAYLDMLSKKKYTTPLLKGKTLRGLGLKPKALAKVLYGNYHAMRASKPKDTVTGTLDYSKMGVVYTGRDLGTWLPPDHRWARPDKKPKLQSLP